MRSGLKPTPPLITPTKRSNQIKALAHLELPENITIKEDGTLVIDSLVSLLKSEHIEMLLNNYSKLKEECEEDLEGDMHWLLIDLENLVHQTFKDSSPVYYNLII